MAKQGEAGAKVKGESWANFVGGPRTAEPQLGESSVTPGSAGFHPSAVRPETPAPPRHDGAGILLDNGCSWIEFTADPDGAGAATIRVEVSNGHLAMFNTADDELIADDTGMLMLDGRRVSSPAFISSTGVVYGPGYENFSGDLYLTTGLWAAEQVEYTPYGRPTIHAAVVDGSAELAMVAPLGDYDPREAKNTWGFREQAAWERPCGVARCGLWGLSGGSGLTRAT